ncbi:MAG: FG-GAP repeat protein [Planctomycetes bacterium]|nr:FG-GAP repeat protein [Planctomycetota bacterium]
MAAAWLALAALAIPHAEDPLPIVIDLLLDEGGTSIIEPEEPDEFFAAGTYGLGDVNGDGVEDFSFYAGASDEGAGYIVFGRDPFPERILTADLGSFGSRVTTRTEYHVTTAAPAGDLDGDGNADMFFRASHLQWGHLAVLFGEPDLPADFLAEDAAVSLRGILFRGGPDLGDEAGMSFEHCGAGDVNGDGFPDILIGVRNSDAHGVERAGRVYLVFGAETWPPIIDIEDVGESWPGVIFTAVSDEPARHAGQSFGRVAGIGDVNGDGFADVLLGAPGWRALDDDDHLEMGTAFLVFGRDDFAAEVNLEKETSLRTAFRGTEKLNDLGRIVLGVGDINGNGSLDFAITGRPWALIVDGSREFPEEVLLDASAADIAIASGDAFRLLNPLPGMIAPVPDFDGDGTADLCVSTGASYTRGTIASLGYANLIPGRPDLPHDILIGEASPYAIAIPGTSRKEEMAESVSSADVDGDGLSDLLIGAPGLLPQIEPETQSHLYIVRGRRDPRGPLRISGYSPHQGTSEGGTRVRIRGAGFTSATQVFFGTREAASYERIDSANLTVATPPGTDGEEVEVRVLHPGEEVRFDERFRYRGGAIQETYEMANLGGRGIRIYEDRENDPTRWMHLSPHLEPAGDVNGDGLDDLFFSSQSGDARRPGGDSIYILLGSRNPPEEFLMSAFTEHGIVLYSGTEGDEFGCGRSAPVGDMNGDGRGDLISLVRPPDGEWGFLLIYGDAFAPLAEVEEHVFGQGKGAFIRTERSYSEFGVPFGGDFTGDGLSDAVIIHSGPVAEDDVHLDVGRISILPGDRAFPRDADIRGFPTISGESVANDDKEYIGRILDGWAIGDVNGDGFDDFAVVWSTSGDSRFVQWYEIYVILGRPRFQQRSTLAEEKARGMAVLLAKRTGWFECRDMSTAGDQNGDGIGDIFMAVRTGVQGGATFHGGYVLYGGTTLPTNRRLGIPEDFDASFLWKEGTNCGIYYADGGGDFNGDGRPDLMLTDSSHPSACPPITRTAYLFFGGDLPEAPTPIPDVVRMTRLVDDYGGYPKDVSFCGDLNGDGAQDVAVMDGNHLYVVFSPVIAGEREFRRGDANQSGQLEIGDAIVVLNALFVPGAGEGVPCWDATDANDDEIIDLSDAMRILMLLFADGPVLPPPFGECGPDPFGDELDCLRSACP